MGTTEQPPPTSHFVAHTGLKFTATSVLPSWVPGAWFTSHTEKWKKSRKRKRRLWTQYNLSEERLWSPVLKWWRRLQVKAWALCLWRAEESWAIACVVVVTAVSRTIFSEIQEAKSESFSSSLRAKIRNLNFEVKEEMKRAFRVVRKLGRVIHPFSRSH